MAAIVFITLIAVNAEVQAEAGGCDPAQGECEYQGIEDTAQICGYLMVCFSQPLIFLAYAARFLRVRKVFDAQVVYFKTGNRPSDMIRRYSEPLLASYITGICAAIFIVYMAVVIIPWAVNPANDYGVLPTFALG